MSINVVLVEAECGGLGAKDSMVKNGAIFSSCKEMFLKSRNIFAGRRITATPYNGGWYIHLCIMAAYLQ